MLEKKRGYLKVDSELSWQDWQRFLAIAECGSLNRAAEQLGSSQPSLSRQLLALESALGRNLFNRSTQGLTLTDFGQALVEDAQHMAHSAQRLARLVQGQDISLTGAVRLSANEMLAHYYLPALLPQFLEQYPELQLQVVVTNQASNLDRRDADVAIRMFRPAQQDLVTRHLMDIGIGIYASEAYLAKHGAPSTPEALFQHRVLGFDRDKQMEEGAQALGWSLTNDDFFFRTDNMPLLVETAVHDGGLVFTHHHVGEQTGLKEVHCGLKIPALPIYLTCHRDVQHNKKIRVLMDFLAEHLPGSIHQVRTRQLTGVSR